MVFVEKGVIVESNPYFEMIASFWSPPLLPSVVAAASAFGFVGVCPCFYACWIDEAGREAEVSVSAELLPWW